MRDRYRDGYEDSPAATRQYSYPDPPGATRDLGLRRLGKLTWRTIQLGALATVGLAIVFAKTATAPAANVQVAPPTQAPQANGAATRPAAQLATKKPKGAASTRPGTQSTAPGGQPSSAPAGAAPSPRPATQPTTSAPKPTLAPPTTAPKPAPATSSPVPTATSTTHTGG
jgi:hypothetical protein